jgi:hypothetical protein
MTRPQKTVEDRAPGIGAPRAGGSRTVMLLAAVTAFFGLLAAALAYQTIIANREKANAVAAAELMSGELADVRRENETLRGATAVPAPAEPTTESSSAPADPSESASPSESTSPDSSVASSASASAAPVRWQGKVRIADGIDLDAEPPQDATFGNDLTSGAGPALGIRADVRLAPWVETTMPGRGDCYTRAVTQSWRDGRVVVEKVQVGTRYCVETKQGHTALLTVARLDGEAFFADVLVWENG